MTLVCIRCHQPITPGTEAEPVMTGHENSDKSVTLFGIRAQHPAAADGKSCDATIVDDYPGGYRHVLFDRAEQHPFPAYRKWRSTAPEDPA